MESEILTAIGSSLFTAFLTAYVTAKANEKVLKSVIDRLDEIDRRTFNQERRLSRLEGLFRTIT